MTRVPARWLWHGLLPLASGFLWLSAGFGNGPVGLLISILPGAFLIAGGVSLLFWAGDARIPQFTALAGLVSVILGFPGLALYSPGMGVVLIILGAASFVAAGFAVLRQSSPPEATPRPHGSISNAAKVALDDALLAYFAGSAKIPQGGNARNLAGETREWLDLVDQKGWHKNPEAFHREPPALESPRIEQQRFVRLEYELLSFDSGYEPYPEQPGAARWQSYSANHTAYARLLRHPDGPRPWLIGIHGYRMGIPALDFPLFEPQWLHQELGLNILLPVLPLHGPRKNGLRSGDGYLEGNLPDMVNAQAQAIWDIRRLLDWVRRSEQAPAVGVLGYSLGGYNTALLGCLESELACLIAGIPAVDLAELIWQYIPPAQAEYLKDQGVGLSEARAAMEVVSPLSMPCRIQRERRFIFAGVVDQLVFPGQVERLHEHWQQPRLEWYQGGHLTFRRERGVKEVIREGLETGGLLG